jgi:hypothetical protein
MKASPNFRDGVMMIMKACQDSCGAVIIIMIACQKFWEAVVIIMKISRKLKQPGINKSDNSLIISYLNHKGTKSSPNLQHHTGMMPEASKELKQPGGKKNRNLLKTNWLIC